MIKRDYVSPLSGIHFLLGHWITSGRIIGDENAHISGIDTYELVSDSRFILHRVEVLMAEERVSLVEIIGVDKNDSGYIMHSFDHKGETTVMYGVLKATNVMELEGDDMRATLTHYPEKNEMKALWERYDSESGWASWMEIHFTRSSKHISGN